MSAQKNLAKKPSQITEGLRITREDILLPLEIATWIIAIIAQRASGKTYTAGDLIEEFWNNKIPFVVIDPLGIYWGLKYKQKVSEYQEDGKTKTKIEIAGPFMPILVFGGKNADRPLTLETVPALVETIVKTNLSCVLDVSEFTDYKDLQIVTLFLNTLFKANGRSDRQVIIEEADLFCPEITTYPQEVDCRHAVNNFVVRGGNNNLGCTLITQRSASVAKKTLTQADCLFILRTTAPQDVKVIQDWVTKKRGKIEPKVEAILETLERLEPGEGYIYKPTKPDPIILEHVHFRPRISLHATRDWKKQNPEPIPEFNLAEQLALYDTEFREKTKAGPYDLYTLPQLKKLLADFERNLGIKDAKIVDLLGYVARKDSDIKLLEGRIERQDSQIRNLQAGAGVIGDQPIPPLAFSNRGDLGPGEIETLRNIARNAFTDQEVERLRKVATLTEGEVALLTKIASGVQGGPGQINVQLPGGFEVNSIRAQEPPKQFSTTDWEGRIVWVLLSKFKGKSTAYKAVREEVDRIWGGFSAPQMTNSKKALAEKRIIVDNGAFIRANWEVGPFFVDGKELSPTSGENEVA